MRSLQEHAAAVAALVPPRPTEAVNVGPQLVGRVLAADVAAAGDLPPFDNSQMDGYALTDSQLTGGEFAVGQTVAAGADPDELYPHGTGEVVVPVMTGAKVPRGTAAVVAVEKCAPAEFLSPGQRIEVPAASAGQFVRPQGSDIRAGEPLLPAGCTVTPVGVAALAGQSIQQVQAYSRTSILIVTGGAEVGGTGAASIADSNGPLLASLAARYGIDVAGFVRTNDDPALLRADLEDSVDKHRPTVVVTSGGISAGKFEVVRRVFAADGWFGHVDQQPGGPQGLAHMGTTPVVCLPGNPMSTLVSFRIFLAPALGNVPDTVTAQLATPCRGLPDDREQLLRGHLTSTSAGTLEARPLAGTSSHLLAQAATADCLIRIPARADLPAGAPVTVYPL